MTFNDLGTVGGHFRTRRGSVMRWGLRGFWAVVDQGLTATANFIVSVALARWLSEADYGSFATAYALLLLIGTAHTALVTEPYLVFAQGRYAGRSDDYLRFAWRAHWVVSVAAGSLTLLGWMGLRWIGQDRLGDSVLAIGLSVPFFFLSWLARRAAIAHLRPTLAALGSGTYLVCLVAGLFAMRATGLVRSDLAFLLMATAGAISAFVIRRGLRPRSSERGATSSFDRRAARRHWRYGRWALSTGFLSWLPANIYFIVLPISAGLVASGALRALLNLTTPIMHAVISLGTLIVPALSAQGRRTGSFRLPRSLMWLFTLLPFAYWLALGLFGPELLDWIYAGRYAEHAVVLWILGLLPPVAGWITIFGAELRARERPDLIFYAYVAGAAVTCTAGVLLAVRFELIGAAIGWLLSYLTLAATHHLLLTHRARDG